MDKLTIEEINVLGNIINTSWGKSVNPTTKFHAPNSTNSIKISLLNDESMQFTFTTFTNYNGFKPYVEEKQRFEHEATSVTNTHINRVKKEFKEESGKALNLKIKDYSDEIEVLQTNPYSGRVDALYRRKTIVSII